MSLIRRLSYRKPLDAYPIKPFSHYNLVKSSHLYQALFLWKRGEESLKEKAAESFLAFRSLGHFYEQLAGDRQRATNCYQRDVTLNLMMPKLE